MVRKPQAEFDKNLSMPKSAVYTSDPNLVSTNNDVDPNMEVDPSAELSQEQVRDIKRRSVAGTISYLFRTAVLQGLSIVGALVLSAYLTPADFGIYGIVIQIMGLLVFFSDVGLAASLVQSKEEPTVTDYRTAFTIQQILAWLIVAVVAVIVASGWLQPKIGNEGVLLLLSMAISFPIAGLKTVPSIIMERKLDYSKLVIPQIAENLVFQGLLIYLAISGLGVMAYTYAFLARAVVGVAIMWVIQPWSIGLSLARKSIKGMLNFGVKYQMNDLIARVKDQLFFLVVARFMTPTEFGYIQWSKTLSVFPYSLTVQNVTAILFPTFSRLQSHPALLKKAIEKSLFFSSILVFPMLAAMCLFIWPATQAIDKYSQWQPAVISFIFFSLSVAGAALANPVTNMLNAIGKIDATLKFMIFWTALTWTLTPIAVWYYGFNGVAIAAFIVSLTSILPIIYIRRSIEFNFLGQVWGPLVATGVMTVVTLVGINYWAQDFMWLLVGMVIAGATYGIALLAVLRRRLFNEIMSLKA